MAKSAYHSALQSNNHLLIESRKAQQVLRRSDHAEGLAFCYDIMQDLQSGLPEHFDSCDVLYLDPPWRSGFKVFNDRVDSTPSQQYTFKDFRKRVAELVDSSDVPVVLIWGKGDADHLPKSNHTQDIILNGNPAVAYYYGVGSALRQQSGEQVAIPTTEDIIRLLAQSFDRVGDFVCGYGNTGRIFAENGKSFTLSDMDPLCIGYIEQEIEGWI
jgi:hypothetical protein